MRKAIAAAAVIGAAAAALVAGPATADTNPSTSGAGSVLGGNQVLVPVSIPVNACGNAISALGLGGAAGTGCTATTQNP